LLSGTGTCINQVSGIQKILFSGYYFKKIPRKITNSRVISKPLKEPPVFRKELVGAIGQAACIAIMQGASNRLAHHQLPADDRTFIYILAYVLHFE
jgi:hypothetical protein